MSNENTDSGGGVFGVLKIVPPWMGAIALVVAIVLAFMSYLSGTPFYIGEMEIGFKKCDPGACITDKGECGYVKLHAWCANPDESPDSCGTEFTNALPDKPYFTDPRKQTTAAGKRAGVKWVCIAKT